MRQADIEGARVPVVRASLCVGAVVTEYLRAGTGPAVLILEPWLAAAVREGAVPGEWRSHRLIVPMHATLEALAAPANGGASTAFNAWLRGFIDGLGLSELNVVVTPALEGEVRRFAAEHPDEIARIVTVPPGAHPGGA